jgi:hypothetical protein
MGIKQFVLLRRFQFGYQKPKKQNAPEKSYLEKTGFWPEKMAKSQNFLFFEITYFRCILSQRYVYIFGIYAKRQIF